jgi:endonuclease-3
MSLACGTAFRRYNAPMAKRSIEAEKTPAGGPSLAAAPPHPRPRAKFANAAVVRAIFTRFRDANPHPEGELEFVNPFTLLIAVVLSAQATDSGVNKATRALFKEVDTPQKMLALGEERLREAIKTIGLYRNKAKNVIALSEALISRYGGAVPRTREALETLPGVGRKTANVVLNTAFGEPTIAVDTHVFRVSNRIPLAAGATPVAVETGLERAIPPEFKRHAHHWLILHGRYVCKARRPECPRCLINDLCKAPEKAVEMRRAAAEREP